MKKIFVIRHCDADGQPPEAKLTEIGVKQAYELSEFLKEKKIDRIISSPFTRALDSIRPLSEKLNINVEIDDNLSERVLSTKNYSDWLEKLEATFDDVNLSFEGGESSSNATKRIVGVVERVFGEDDKNTAIVTHGNLMSLLLKYYNNSFGFNDWKNLSNPDVYILSNNLDEVTVERIWKE